MRLHLLQTRRQDEQRLLGIDVLSGFNFARQHDEFALGTVTGLLKLELAERRVVRFPVGELKNRHSNGGELQSEVRLRQCSFGELLAALRQIDGFLSCGHGFSGNRQ